MKHFRAHLGNVQDIALNHNGTLLATVSNDKMAKIFDVVNFDMINIIKLGNDFLHGVTHQVHYLVLKTSKQKSDHSRARLVKLH